MIGAMMDRTSIFTMHLALLVALGACSLVIHRLLSKNLAQKRKD
jgi:hypothetical protein